MKFGVISDIHGNMEALEAVLKRLDREKVDEIICLGDIVGYGANPNECCDLIRRHCTVAVLGNHDEWTLHPPDRGFVSGSVWESIQWTSANILETHRIYLASLPLIVHRDDAIFVHAAPVNPNHWHYITDYLSASRYFQYMEDKKCFVGHSHLPGIYMRNAQQKDASHALSSTVINVGSVGQPRDGNTNSCFCIFDSNAVNPISIVRQSYDFAKTGERIIAAELPRFFAYRLTKGF